MTRSLWLEQTLPEGAAAGRLTGPTRADVAIVGGGYVGLWTAIHIKQREPGCDVVVLEQDICGGGASGRNGGFVLTWWPKINTLVALCGEQEALRLAAASERAIAEIAAFCAAEKIDVHFVRGGWLWSATNRAQEGAWLTVLRTCDRLGVSPFEQLAPAEVASRTGSPVHRAGVVEPSNATIHPAALARGLRRAALARGVRIYEQTRVTTFSRTRPVGLLTASGHLVKAERLVLANGAWASGVRELSRRMVVVSSDIVATEPIPDRLAAIGWTDGCAITDSQLRVHYYRTTRDGRIVFGKGGGALAFGGALGARFDRDEGRAAETERDLRRIYPQLGDVKVTHNWSGAVERTATALPLIGRLGGRQHIVHGVGWSGHGVGPSYLGARMLASLVLGGKDEWSEAGIVDRRMGGFPPEPLRYLGGSIVQSAVTRKEYAEWDGRRPSRVDAALARLAPHE
jgi:glycine/D-amino acid oxidase-like deaminating enzyme